MSVGKRVLQVFAIVTLVICQARATDLYVSPTGDDGANGSLAAPFKTLGKAKAAVRNLLQSSGDPINVYARAGTYYLDSTLLFTPQDGGTVTRPVSYSAYQNEKVTLSGGRKISPTWSTFFVNIQVATIGTGYDFDMLFLNDNKMLTMARWPNFDSTQLLQGCGDYSGRIASWKNPAGGFVRAIHGSHWGGNSFRITGKNGGTLALEWVGDNARGSTVVQNEQMVENIFEELDAPGEWFYDKNAGKLYIYPPSGMDLTSSSFVGATLEELIKVVGTSTQKVKYLTFSGFTLTHTHRTLFTQKYENVSKSDWAIARAGTVYVQDAENITIKNCNFPFIGGNGIFMSAYNRNHLVQNCDFTNIGATAVAIIGDPSVQRKAPDYTAGPANDNYPKDIIVTYCYMYNNGMFEKQTSAVCIGMSANVTVSHCTAHHGPRAGFNICDGTFGGHVFEYNDLYDQVRESQDHGPFNSWMRDRWTSVSGDNARQYALIDVINPVIIRYNRVNNPANQNNLGVDLDDGSSNVQIYNNLLLHVGFKSQHGFNHTVYNNVIINDLGTFHQWNLPDMRKFVTHNIIVNKAPYYCRTKDFFPNTGEIDSNVFWNNGSAVTLQIDNGSGEISATPTWNQYKLDVHSVTADPKFVDVSKCNYQVQVGSPALTLGFKNFPMDQFGKPGYPACPGCSPAVTKNRPRITNESAGSPTPSLTALAGKNAFRFGLRNSAEVTFRVYSLSGRLILQRTILGSKGENIFGWDPFGKLPNASYMVEMHTEKENDCYIKILKIR
jgi:hypothetical protein